MCLEWVREGRGNEYMEMTMGVKLGSGAGEREAEGE